MAPSHGVVFRRLVRLGSFLACWRQANVTPIPKGPPSSSVANYWSISITSVLSKVFDRLVSVRFGRFMECSGVLPTTKFAYRKGLGTCDALLCVSHTLQGALERGRRLGSCRSTSAQPLIGSTIWAFSISSALWVLEVLSCLYWHSFYQTDHSKFWWMVVKVNRWMLYQECAGQCFGPVIVSPVHVGAFFNFLISADWLCWWVHFDGCCAINRRQSLSSRVPDPWSWQG